VAGPSWVRGVKGFLKTVSEAIGKNSERAWWEEKKKDAVRLILTNRKGYALNLIQEWMESVKSREEAELIKEVLEEVGGRINIYNQVVVEDAQGVGGELLGKIFLREVERGSVKVSALFAGIFNLPHTYHHIAHQTVVALVNEGKISPEEGERLIETANALYLRPVEGKGEL